MPTYYPATQAEIDAALAAFYSGASIPNGFAVNLTWPEKVRRVDPDAPAPAWPGWFSDFVPGPGEIVIGGATGPEKHDFGADVANTAAVKRVDPGTAGGRTQSLRYGPTKPVWAADMLNVRAEGAYGDDSHDDTTVLQQMTDYLAGLGRGVMFWPDGIYRANLVLKAGVTWTSLRATHGTVFSGVNPVLIKAATTGWVIDTPATAISNAAVEGIDVAGNGTATGGVRIQDGSYCALRRLHVHGVQKQGVLTLSGNPNVYEDILITSALLDRAPSENRGAFELYGADHYVSRIEAGASQQTDIATVTGADLRNAAFLAGCTNAFFSQCVGEFSDRGWMVTAGGNHFTACRGDHNYGHDWEIGAGNNLLAVCSANEGGMAAANTYDGFKLTGFGNALVACQATQAGGTTYKYLFEDTVLNGDPTNRNSYLGCGGHGYGTAMWSTGGWIGSSPHVGNASLLPGDGTASIDVTAAGIVAFDNYATPTTVTAFTGGVQGQELTLIGNPNVTIQNSAAIITNTGANVTLTAGRAYRLVNYDNKWHQV